MADEQQQPALAEHPEGYVPEAAYAAAIEERNVLRAANIGLDEQLASAREVLAAMDEKYANHEALVAERDALQAQLAQANETISVTAAAQPKKARRFVSITPLPDDALHDKLTSQPVTLVFCEGNREILGVDPVTVAGGKAWVKSGERLVLKERLELTGPNKQGVTVTGVAALIDGDQVGWCQLFEPVAIPPGQTSGLRDTIIF